MALQKAPGTSGVQRWLAPETVAVPEMWAVRHRDHSELAKEGNPSRGGTGPPGSLDLALPARPGARGLLRPLCSPSCHPVRGTLFSERRQSELVVPLSCFLCALRVKGPRGVASTSPTCSALGGPLGWPASPRLTFSLAFDQTRWAEWQPRGQLLQIALWIPGVIASASPPWAAVDRGGLSPNCPSRRPLPARPSWWRHLRSSVSPGGKVISQLGSRGLVAELLYKRGTIA